MDVHPTKNGIFIGIDPYPYGSIPWKFIGSQVSLSQSKLVQSLSEKPAGWHGMGWDAMEMAHFVRWFTIFKMVISMAIDNLPEGTSLYFQIYPHEYPTKNNHVWRWFGILSPTHKPSSTAGTTVASTLAKHTLLPCHEIVIGEKVFHDLSNIKWVMANPQ